MKNIIKKHSRSRLRRKKNKKSNRREHIFDKFLKDKLNPNKKKILFKKSNTD